VTRARGDAGLDGFLNLCKERGPTSHDLVARARRLLGTRRIGHAGTLDPLAEGVLPLALGRATRLIDQLAAADKEYYAEVNLSVRTTTDDAEGEPLEQFDVPRFDGQALDQALDSMVGMIEQRPPAYSAIKVGGRRAYELARSGQDLSLPARQVTIYQIERRCWDWPVLGLTVYCSKGTYIRSLARDLGLRLGTGGVLRRLVRLRVGPFALSEAVSLDEAGADVVRHMLPADAARVDAPAAVLGPLEVEHVRHGRRWPAPVNTSGSARAYDLDGRLIGFVEAADGHWQPRLRLAE
jgi:tRNA pseudouridine55 synthase